MKRFGYLELVHSNVKALKCLRMVMALPLLPSHKIVEGFQIIKAYVIRYNVNLTRLFDFYNRLFVIFVIISLHDLHCGTGDFLHYVKQ